MLTISRWRNASKYRNCTTAINTELYAYISTHLAIMPAVSVPGSYQTGGPSCWDRIKLGFTIGFCVGLASGALFGGFTAMRYGLRGRELFQNLGKTMVQGGGTFGTFMAIGSGIRC